MRANSRRSTVGCDHLSPTLPACSPASSRGWSKLRCNIDSYLIFIVTEGGSIAVASGVDIKEGNRAEAIEYILDAGIRADDVILAQLAEELVVLVSAGER